MTQSYNEVLYNRFKDLKINLVRHNDSPTGHPICIEVQLNAMPKLKDRGTLVLDLGNYIYRFFGLAYQMTPEYRGKGKKTTLRWFMSWDDIKPIIPNIMAAMTLPRSGLLKVDHYLPFEFRSLIIQDSSRGVYVDPQSRL